MSWKCEICGAVHDATPTCFGIEAPWRALVPEAEFSERVTLSADQCVIDDRTFFVRGHIEIPIHDFLESLAFSVWCSLSESSFSHMSERWESPLRASDSPYFGWLCSPIVVYPSTIHLKVAIQSRAPGFVPSFTVAPTDHRLAIDQRNGITTARWHEIVHRLLHT